MILFDFWMTKTIPAFIFSCIVLFVAGILLEFFVYLRTEREKKESSYINVGDDNLSDISTSSKKITQQHLVSSLLYLLQFVWGYMLMLSIMTFNVFIFMSISLGVFIGYIFFGQDRPTVIKELCH